MKSNPSISSIELFLKINNHWLFLFLFALTGALVSYVIAILIIQPVYISSSQTSIGINFKEIGHISQYDQDQYIGLVEALFLSDDVLQSTLKSLESDNIFLTEQEFLDNRSLERKANLLLLNYISNDKNKPQMIVSTWNQVAFNKLSESYEHALKYQTYTNFQNSYLSCVQNSVNSPAASFCESMSKQIPSSETIMEEKVLSNGIFPGLTFYLVDEEASLPKVVRNQTSMMVLAGFFTGLIFAFLILLFVRKQPSAHENINS